MAYAACWTSIESNPGHRVQQPRRRPRLRPARARAECHIEPREQGRVRQPARGTMKRDVAVDLGQRGRLGGLDVRGDQILRRRAELPVPPWPEHCEHRRRDERKCRDSDPAGDRQRSSDDGSRTEERRGDRGRSDQKTSARSQLVDRAFLCIECATAFLVRQSVAAGMGFDIGHPLHSRPRRSPLARLCGEAQQRCTKVVAAPRHHALMTTFPRP